MEVINDVYQILNDVKLNVNADDFSGLGVVVYTDLSDLQFLSLNCKSSILKRTNTDIISTMSESCRKTVNHHDGFFLMNSALELTHRNIYLSPEIPKDKKIGTMSGRAVGARFVTALLSSFSHAVLIAGVVSQNGQISIFQSGKVVKDTDD